jgi:hypothetical protein
MKRALLFFEGMLLVVGCATTERAKTGKGGVPRKGSLAIIIKNWSPDRKVEPSCAG